MAARMRLTRTGRKKAPHYRVVVADSKAPRDGKYIERVGIYSPRETENPFLFDEEKALKWLRQGVQPTETVKSLLQKAGIWKKFIEEKQKKQPAA